MGIARRLSLAVLAAGLLVPPARADQVRLLELDRDAAQLRVDLVQGARERIDAAYFIYADDQTGRVGFWLLREAVRRGVEVRLLVDWQWNDVARPMLAYLQQEGIQVRLYHPFRLLRPFWWNRRMHDKLLVVDGQDLVVGGRNIENAYFGFGQHQYLDRDVWVHGEAAAEAASYFQRLWDSGHVVEPASWGVTDLDLAEARERVDEGLEILGRVTVATLAARHDWSSQTLECGDVRFLHDAPTGKRKRPGIGAELLRMADEAEVSVIVESPYLVLTRGMRRTVRGLVDRGVQVRILTNSLKTTDNVFAQAGYVGRKRGLVRMGVELWEYSGLRSLHSKTLIIDGRRVIVGTYNLDPRSERLNAELAVVVDDAELARLLRVSMDRDLEQAWRIQANGKPEGQASRYPGVRPFKKVKLFLIRLLVPFIHGQL